MRVTWWWWWWQVYMLFIYHYIEVEKSLFAFSVCRDIDDGHSREREIIEIEVVCRRSARLMARAPPRLPPCHFPFLSFFMPAAVNDMVYWAHAMVFRQLSSPSFLPSSFFLLPSSCFLAFLLSLPSPSIRDERRSIEENMTIFGRHSLLRKRQPAWRTFIFSE